MGPPVFRAEAHGDLEHLGVHHVGDHSQEACGGAEQESGSKVGLCAPHGPTSARQSMDGPPHPTRGRTVAVNVSSVIHATDRIRVHDFCFQFFSL